MEEGTWRRAVGKVRDDIHTRAPKSLIRTPRTNRGEDEHRSRSSHASHSGGSEHGSHRSSHGAERNEGSRSEQRGSEDADLKQREYKDEKGEIHHHTRTYQEQHRGERDKK